MAIERITPDHTLWSNCCAHLKRHNMVDEVTDGKVLLPALYLLAAVEENVVVGHLSLRMQRVVIPATEWGGGKPRALTGPDGRPLRELFVRSFAVDAEVRRQGYGRALQLAALDLTRRLGCYQLRSWSSLDKDANYALKLALGFGVHPAVQPAGDGTLISGVYFVKTICHCED